MYQKLRSRWLLLIAVLTIVPQAPGWSASPASPPQKAAKVVLTDHTRKAVEASNVFAFDLYARLCRQEDDLFYSPASISTALSMAYLGAAGKTRRQMADVLHLEQVNVPEGFGSLGNLLSSGGRGYRLHMANRLWGQRGYPFRAEFLAATSRHFAAELTPLDFSQAAAASETINRWVEQQTEGKIQQLVSQDSLGDQMRLVLTNAIYFKGAWEDEFWKSSTQQAAFHLSATREVKLPLMYQQADFRYAENEVLQLVILPYAGRELSMVVLLPKQIDGLAALEQQLSAKNLKRWLSDARERNAQVFLPRFKVTRQVMLGDALRAMGMNLAFSRQADFSHISSALRGEGLMLSEVIHKAFVDVSEEGTEAAAATAVLAPAAAPLAAEPEKPAVFRADHPFVFLLRDERTGALLFIGRLIEPSAAN